MRRKKAMRPLALFLAFVLCIGMLPLAALAENADPAVLPDVSSECAEEAMVLEDKGVEPQEAVNSSPWKMQDWGGDEDVPLQAGWITASESNDGFTIDFGKINKDNAPNYKSVVVYENDAEAFTDSTLELDLTMLERQADPSAANTFQVAIFPRFVDGKNCDGFGIGTSGGLQECFQVAGSEGWPAVENKAEITFEIGKTYHFRLETIANHMTVYIQCDEGAEQELTSFNTRSGIAKGGYGFRFWGYDKTVSIQNIKRTEIKKSSLQENEKQIDYADWGNMDVVIPVSFADGDSIASIESGEGTVSGADYVVDADGITLKAGYIARHTDGTISLTITFAKGVVERYTLTRKAQAAESHGWVIQRQGTNESLVPREGWITPTDKGISIHVGKIMADNNGDQGWVVFDGEAEQYLNSILEYDVTFTDSEDGAWIASAPATRVIDGRNYEGFAITQGTGLERTGRKDNAENFGGISNLTGTQFEYGTTYHLRMVTLDNNITVYIKDDQGEEKKLTSFDSPIGLSAGSYGFRIWRGGKTITIENVKRTEIITSALSKSSESIPAADWGKNDINISVSFGRGDAITSITNGEAILAAGTDYTVENAVLTLSKDYIASQNASFKLKVTFDKGSEATFRVMRYDATVQHEYTWTPDQGIDMWTRIDGNGIYALEEGGMRIADRNVLVNDNAPFIANGEIELTFEMLNDDGRGGLGGLFRVDADDGSWQAVTNIEGAENVGFINSNGATQIIVNCGTNFTSRDGVKDIKMKMRIEDDNVTIWMDDGFVCTAPVDKAVPVLGGMGLFVDNGGDILVKKVVFREVSPFRRTEGERRTKTIENDGLIVRLDEDFPRVVDYTMNGKSINGSEIRYNYVTINAMDIPSTAVITNESADSITYHVTPAPDKTGVSFDVKFTVLDDQILEMLILNILEPADELVYAIGLPRQPLISANSAQEGAALDAAFLNGAGFGDIHEAISNKNISTTADRAVTIPIITANGLSASMLNNVFVDRFEYLYRAFDMDNGEITAGFWNTQYMYRGLDDEKILPFPTEPDESNPYCRVVVTEDTNGDDIVDWQDGANALKKLNGNLIPGGEDAARSFFHVGYNFASGVQHPFLKVADNMKRLSNCMDGFSQNLIFKGYANEGHDSGHADYADVNMRAGGAEDMNVAIDEGHKINSNFGIHINAYEAYPEAQMFNDHVISQRRGWYWMDQAMNIRRELDMLEGTFDKRLNDLFRKTPDLDFVYVDCWWGYRWDQVKLIGNMVSNGAEMFATENGKDMNRFNVMVHQPETNANTIHHFVYHTQKDVYRASPIYWGGYGRGVSMMSWQHQNNINTMVNQFFTNQLPQKYLMCHEVLKDDGATATFEGGVTSSNWIIMKDGNKLTDGQGKIFIPWYAEDSETRDPDEAAKIYHWNSAGGNSTWTLPASWSGLTTVYLYKTTQNGKVLAETLTVTDGQVTINAAANTGYVLYPTEAEADMTEWSVGSPIRDTGFNSRDFSIWQKGGDADIRFNDDGNGVSILTMSGTAAGQVSQAMSNLVPGQKYRALVYAGSANGKTARMTVETSGGETVSNYVDQIYMNNQYFDNYALGKSVQLMWVDFVATDDTATITLSADDCANANGLATFMETRIVKTNEPDLPKGYVANETFEFVEQGAYGIFHPERAADGVPHLSQTHIPYTNDTISGNWSLKMYGRAGHTDIRTSPATMRLAPNTEYAMEFDTLSGGTVYVVSESDGGDEVLRKSFDKGHSRFEFTTGDKTDYITRIVGCEVLDNFQVYAVEEHVPVADVSLEAAEITMGLGETTTLTAAISPIEASNKSVSWVSSNRAVAEVGSTGVVTAASEGTATITVTTVDGGFTAQCTVTVKAESEPPVDPVVPGVTRYTIKAGAGEGGSITPAGSVSVERNASKTFAIKADAGYVISDVLVDGASVGAVASYTFEKVTRAHTITAEFRKADGAAESGFADVAEDAWYADAVAYVTERGLFNGVGGGRFAPMDTMTRAMFFAVLHRMSGEDAGGLGETWYSNAMRWAVTQGISDGAAPEADITREQLAAMLYRYAKAEKTQADLSGFTDRGSISHWAADAMTWAVAEGIITGKSGGKLDPSGLATRAEVATMLRRFIESSVK